MPNCFKKIFFLFLAIFILVAGFYGGLIDKKENHLAQASLWDAIKAWVTINPLEIDVSAPAEIEINKVFEITAKITNKGEGKIENAKGEIFLPDGLVLLQNNPVQKIGIIQGKKSKKISWTARGTKKGNYIITASAAAELKRNLLSAESSTIIEVKKNMEKPRLRKWYQKFFDFFRGWFGRNKYN